MKQYFLKNMHLEDRSIEKMLDLREAALRRKQSQHLNNLNYKLENNLLTQEEFLDRLSELTHSFEEEKQAIDQAKADIYQGYQAQLSLLRHTALDARYFGCNIPFCRSMEIFPRTPKWHFDSVMIDELNELTKRRKSFESEVQQQNIVENLDGCRILQK